MARPRVALATCSLFPQLEEDDAPLVGLLAGLGVDATAVVWDSGADWTAYDSVVIRDTWDYAPRRDAFVAWTAALPHVMNSAQVIAWNTDKRYLRELEAAGIPVVATTWLAPGDSVALPDAECVVKPVISAGAKDTERHTVATLDAARAHAQRLLDAGRHVMVQRYVSSVDDAGETAVVHIDGAYSHAIRKGPVLTPGGQTVDGLFAGEHITARSVADDESDLAERVLKALPAFPEPLLYSRIDIVRDDDGSPMVIEVELTEPSLFLGRGDGAAMRLAQAIAARVS